MFQCKLTKSMGKANRRDLFLALQSPQCHKVLQPKAGPYWISDKIKKSIPVDKMVEPNSNENLRRKSPNSNKFYCPKALKTSRVTSVRSD